MKFKKEWVIEGRFRKDEKFHVVTKSVADRSELGWHWIKSLEEAKDELNRIKRQDEWERERKARKAQSCGMISISTEYYSDYDLVELRISERQVSNWYIVE